MFNYHYLNNISQQGTALWSEDFQPTDNIEAADAIGRIWRNWKMQTVLVRKENSIAALE